MWANSGGKLNAKQQIECRANYKTLILKAEIECPAPDIEKGEKKRGRPEYSYDETAVAGVIKDMGPRDAILSL